MNLDTALYALNTCAEIIVVGLLFYRRVWRAFPFFLAYSLWTLLAGAGGFLVLRESSPTSSIYVFTYLSDISVDAFLLFAVLVELAWSVMKPLRGYLSRTTILVVVVAIILLGAAIWPFSSLPGMANMSWQLVTVIRLKQTVATLAVVIFLVLAAGSQFLSIGWRDRELQIASGLGIYSLVGIVVTVLHTYPSMRLQYNRLDELVVASYVVSLIYWIVSFAGQEQERREMTPQAQNLILAMAGAARTTRISLANASEHNKQTRDQR